MSDFRPFGLSSDQIAKRLAQEYEKRLAADKEKHPETDILVLMMGAMTDSVCQVILDNNIQITMDVTTAIQRTMDS